MIMVKTSNAVRKFVENDIKSLAIPKDTTAGRDNSQVTEGHPRSTGPMYKLPPTPLLGRLYDWFDRKVIQGGPIRSWIFKHCAECRALVAFPIRGALFAKAVFGPRVRKEQYELRMESCSTCPMRISQIQIPTRKDRAAGEPRLKDYCGACGCGMWFMSELKRKNRFGNWKCPLRRHAGLYGDEIYRDLVYPKVDGQPQVTQGGGCKGCGKGGG